MRLYEQVWQELDAKGFSDQQKVEILHLAFVEALEDALKSDEPSGLVICSPEETQRLVAEAIANS